MDQMVFEKETKEVDISEESNFDKESSAENNNSVSLSICSAMGCAACANSLSCALYLNKLSGEKSPIFNETEEASGNSFDFAFQDDGSIESIDTSDSLNIGAERSDYDEPEKTHSYLDKLMDDDVNLVVAEIFEKSKKPEIKQIKKQQKTDPLSIVENKPENTSVINRVVEKKVGNQDLNIEEVEEPRTLKNKETVYEGLFIIPRIKTENLNIIESEPEPEIIVATSEKLLIELPKISELKKESKQLAQSILDNDITLIYQKSIETTEKVQDKPATKTIELFDNETVTEDIEDYVELLISEAITNKAQDDDVEPLDETIEEVIIDENESKPLLADDEFNETGGYYLKQDSLISKEVIKTRSHTFLSVDDDSEIDDNILPIPTRPLSRSVTSSFTTTTNKNYKSDNFISRRLASLVLRMVISKI